MSIELILLALVALAIAIVAIGSMRRKPSHATPSPFALDVARLIKASTGMEPEHISANANAPADMIIYRKRKPHTLIKAIDTPLAPVPQIWIDKLAEAKERSKAQKAILISTGYFERGVRVDAHNAGLTLIDGEALAKLRDKYQAIDAPHPHARYMRPRGR